MADAEVVATYELYNISRTKLEKLIHYLFDRARLDIEIKDRFGQPVVVREWFLAPLFLIDGRKKSGTVRFHVLDTIRNQPLWWRLINRRNRSRPNKLSG